MAITTCQCQSRLVRTARRLPDPRGQQESPGPEAIDTAFSNYLEGAATDYRQLRRAPWMAAPDFIDPTQLPTTPDDDTRSQ